MKSRHVSKARVRLGLACAAITAVALGTAALYARAPTASGGSASTPATAAPVNLPAAAQQELLEHYCHECHNYEQSKGGVEFEDFNPAEAHEDAALAEKMLRKLRAGMMPPAGKPRPDMATVQAFATALETEVDAHAHPNPSTPHVHRLNRAEYQNAVRDVLGLDIDVSQLLPADDSSRGFDNQAGTLTFSPALLDAYLSAAARISRTALGVATTPTQATYRVADDTTQNYHVDGLPFGTRGGIAISHTFPADGTYTLKVFSVNLGNMGNFRPFGEIRGEQLLFYVDGKRVQQVDWDKAYHIGGRVVADDEGGGGGELRTIDVNVPVKAGPHKIGVTFLATNAAPGLDMNHAFDRSTIETGGLPGFTFYPHLGRVRIDGPVQAAPATDSPIRAAIVTCTPKQASDEEPCVRQIATRLARLAYRGQATPADIDTLVHFYAQGRQGASFDAGMDTMLQRLLVDPNFLLRVETPPAGLAAGTPYKVSDLDLASRLSFFIWSSGPDEELLRLADQKQLSQEKVLRAQIERMLADPKASALTTNFADQWLGLRALASQRPLVDQFPDFDDNLRQAMRREVELLFTSFLREDRSILELLTANYTFLDERLARLYGISGVKGSFFRRVTLDESQNARFGLTGKAALLTVSAYPGRTAPTVRGNWVLRTILGVPAPDPPPNVPALAAQNEDPAGNSLPPSMREQMERHRTDPVCAACHKIMDPVGFALEPFDAIGRLRTEDGGRPIDPKSVLYDGVEVDGPAGVRAFLMRHQDQYVRNVTQALITYAIGRGLEYDDMPTMRRLLQTAAGQDYRLKSLIETIALSDLMRMNVVPATQLKAEVSASRTGSAGGR